MSPDALRRLLAELPAPEPPHPIDSGQLGEYAFETERVGQAGAAESYPHVAAHLRAGCDRCRQALIELGALRRRASSAAARAGSRPPPVATQADAASSMPDAPETDMPPEPLEIADAAALARMLDAERETLRASLRLERAGRSDPRRLAAFRRRLLLLEAALIRQRLAARRLFLQRARFLLVATTPARAGGRRTQGVPNPGPRAAGPQNPKARLMLDDFAGNVDSLARLASRIDRLTADLRRLGDDPSGPARSQSEALVERGLAMTREALSVDGRLARLQGPLAGMAT
jgi:hypothetical protein